MNSEIIALIVAIVSFLILVFFVCKKIPKIKEIPESESIFLKKEVKEKVKSKIKRTTKKGTDFFENLLHKFLSRVRILSLKAVPFLVILFILLLTFSLTSFLRKS